MKEAKTFFITGTQRSGTTLLSVAMGQHPAIQIDGYSRAFRMISVLNNYEKILSENLAYAEKEVLNWKLTTDYKRRLADFLDLENFARYGSYRELIHTSIEQFLQREQKEIWGDKSPNLHYYIRDIIALFPTTKIVHIVRDGRATAQSHAVRSHTHVLLAAQEWVRGNSTALVNQQLLGKGQYLIIKYEDLLRQPETTLRQVCDFLELSFSKEMLSLSQKGQADNYVKDHFDTAKIDAFKNDIPAKTLRKIEQIQAPLLNKLGYSLQFADALQKAKPLSLSRWMWLRLCDAIRALFRSKRVGMVNRQNVEVRISWRNRLSKFALHLAHDYLPKRVYERIHERAFNRERRYSKD
ncbi:MAG: sulfotransferase [Saprospiraceae bacterium]